MSRWPSEELCLNPFSGRVWLATTLLLWASHQKLSDTGGRQRVSETRSEPVRGIMGRGGLEWWWGPLLTRILGGTHQPQCSRWDIEFGPALRLADERVFPFAPLGRRHACFLRSDAECFLHGSHACRSLATLPPSLDGCWDCCLQGPWTFPQERVDYRSRCTKGKLHSPANGIRDPTG